MDLVRPTDENGGLVDASFRVAGGNGDFRLFFASRGGTLGTPSARNTQYHIGLTLLLSRLKELDAELMDVLLDSSKARNLPIHDRRVHLTDYLLPLRLSTVANVDALRRALSEAQKNIASASGRSPKHGNRMRSIEIRFGLLRDGDLSAEAVARFLADGPDGVVDEATDDDVILRCRVRRLRARSTGGKAFPRPAGDASPRRSSSTAGRYQRLPSVIAYVLYRAAGKCELCGTVPFLGSDGEPFLEVHHVKLLADGGPDTTDNAAALCPNCHRELHHGLHREERRNTLLSQVTDLRSIP